MRGNRFARGLSVLVMACLAGCANEGFGVDLTVQFDGTVVDSDVAQVSAFTFTVAGDETGTYPRGLTRAAYRTERVPYRPLPATRSLVFSVAAARADGTILALGSTGPVALSAGKTSAATVTLFSSMGGTDMLVDMAHVDLAGDDLWGVSCSDAIQDGDETGIDCGGSCPAACVGATCAADGDCGTGVCDGVCIPASGPPAWLNGPTLSMGRAYMQAAQAADGTLVVVGGTTNGTAAGAVGLVDILTRAGAFIPGPSLNTARYVHGVAADAAGSIYALGGLDAAGAGLGSVERLQGAGPWAARAVTIGMHTYPGTAQVDADHLLLTDTTDYLYSVSGNSWSATTSSTVPRDQAAMVHVPGGKVYQIGGHTGPAVATVEVYDGGLGTWSARASLAVKRRLLGAALGVDGRIYAIGGIDAAALATVEVYLPAANRWSSRVAQLPGARQAMATGVGPDGRIYIAGGINAVGSTTNASLVYGPVFTVAPTSGATGAMITVTIANLAASAAVAILFDGQRVANALSDATGAATAMFSVPVTASSGAHLVSVVDARSQFPVTAAFSVP